MPALGACLLSAAMPLVDARLTDFMFLLRGPRAVEAPVVHITTGAEAAEGEPWGYSPEGLAELVMKVHGAGSSVIVLAITPLTRMPDDHPGLAALADALREAGKVVLPACLVPGLHKDGGAAALAPFSGKPLPLLRPLSLREATLVAPPPELVEAAAGLGATNLYPDTDGVVRTFPLVVSSALASLPSLPLEAVRVARGLPPGTARLDGQRLRLGTLAVPIKPASAEMALDIPGGANARLALTADKVAQATDTELRTALGGCVVVISSSVVGASSLFPTPVGPGATGAELVSACIENLLAGRWLRPVPRYLGWLLALLLAVVTAQISQRLAPLAAVVADALLVLVVFMVLVMALSRGVQLSGLALIFAVIFTGSLNAAGVAAVAERDKLAAEAAFQSRLRALDRIGELLGSSLNRSELLHGIMRWVAHETGVEACSLLLLDEQHGELTFEVALGPKGDEVSDFTVPLGHGIIGVVAQTGEPLIVNEGWRDPRHAGEISSAVDFRPRNILCVPMRLHGKVIGVIEAMNKAGGEDFDLQDSYLLTTIAAQAALLLENARLIAELQQRVDFANAELREAYSQLASEKAKVETLIDQTASPVVATDAANNVVLLNDAAEEALGVRAEDAIEHGVFAVLPYPQLAALFAADLEEAGGRLVEEMELDRGDGRCVVYHASIALVRTPDGAILGKSLVMNDITELRELDRMKNDLVSFVAHELKNPLVVILGFVDLCQRRLERGHPDQTCELLQRIERQARRTERLVQDFLNLSRLEAGRALEFEFGLVTNLGEVVAEVVELEPHRRECHSFDVSVPSDLPPFYADLPKLEEVLTNLISNAVKYSPDGGEIRVEAEADGESVRIAVSDQGVGIPADQQRNLFQKFRRVHGEARRSVPGTGIGLYLCRQIIEGHGGQIWVESEPGRGTTVVFTMPRTCPGVAPETH